MAGSRNLTRSAEADSATTTSDSKHPVPSGARVLWVVVFPGCASYLLARISLNFVDIDIWHQMNLIRASLAAGHLLTEDPFAYVQTVRPMIDHEWGAGVIAFFVGKWMGGAGLLIVKFAVAMSTLTVVMRVAQKRAAAAATLAFLTPIAISLMALGFLATLRAQAYSFLLSAALLWMLEGGRRGNKRSFWAWLFIFPIWVNLHAGFVVGLGFVCLYAIEQAWCRQPVRPALFVLGAMTVETLLNPYGTRYFSFLMRALTMARPRIPEWAPLWKLGWNLTLLFVLAAGFCLYALIQSKTRRADGLLLLTATAGEALLHYKMLPFFAIVWLCYVPALVQRTPAGRWLQEFGKKRREFLVLAAAAAISMCWLFAIKQQFWRTEVPQVAGDVSYPVGAVACLGAQHLQGNMMVPFRTGAYVSWKLYPAIKVSIDSRYEVAYPHDWVERVFRFYEGREGWQTTLDSYPTDMVLAPVNSPVLPRLRQLAWRPIYVDAQFEIDARPGLQLPIPGCRFQTSSGVFP